MQGLGLSPSAARSEGRLKALFWPSIQNETDVDYLGQQGFWICILAAAGSALTGILAGGILFAFAGLDVGFYLLAALGIRERNQYAATAAFVLNTLALIAVSSLRHQPPGILGILMAALLLANVRATWLAATSKFSPDAFDQDRLNATFLDKLTDQWPPKLWPRLQWLFWILFVVEMLLTLVGLALSARHH